MKNAFFLFLLAGWAIAPVFSQNQPVTNKDLKQLAAIMAGEFSSEAQAQADSDYYHITLKMKPMWTRRKDGYWLYVEQAVASAPERPYRQRVYHVFKHDDSTLVSQVYEMQHPQAYIGAWKNPSLLTPLTPDSLIDREGCGIYLHKTGPAVFEGSTPEKACASSLRGASYASSDVTICADRLLSWDRGWNAEGKQVWGAEKGGYVFVKIGALK